MGTRTRVPLGLVVDSCPRGSPGGGKRNKGSLIGFRKFAQWKEVGRSEVFVFSCV